MNTLFSPTPWLDTIRTLSPVHRASEHYTGVRLTVPLADFLTVGNHTWKDFVSFATNKYLLMEENVFVCLVSPAPDVLYHHTRLFAIGTGRGQRVVNVYALANFAEQAANVYTVLLRLLKRSEPTEICIWHGDFDLSGGPALEEILTECDGLQRVSFADSFLDAEQCAALSAASPSSDLQVRFHNCTARQDGAAALADVLRDDHRDNVCFYFDQFASEHWPALAEGLRGNETVKTISHPMSTTLRERLDDDGLDALIAALADNQGLVKLMISQPISNGQWAALFKSVAPHPTLGTLDLTNTGEAVGDVVDPIDVDMEDETKIFRCECALEMLKSNTVIHTLHLTRSERDESMWESSILPHLQINKYRPLLFELMDTPEPLRSKLLSHALSSVNSRTYLLWFLLSGSVEMIVSDQ